MSEDAGPSSGDLVAAINALPNPVRAFVHDLETRCDPAGEVRELFCARREVAALRARLAEVEREVFDYRQRESEWNKSEALKYSVRWMEEARKAHAGSAVEYKARLFVEHRMAALADALLEIERHCPCGARPESLKTHPHVTGCPVQRALALAGPLPVAPPETDRG